VSTHPRDDLHDAVQAALATVDDPEIHKPITELGMVESVDFSDEGVCTVRVLLTVAGCPLRDKITRDVTAAVSAVAGVTGVRVDLGVMRDEQRRGLSTSLRGGAAEKEVPFAQPGSLTRVYAVASGKGGVGKSSVTVNLAAALSQLGLRVGVLDADIYGHSIPHMLGISQKPVLVDRLMIPPVKHDLKLMSIGFFVEGNEPLMWRGPMLHRALEQFLQDVHWGELDALVVDMPPGTGDVSISLGQMLPRAEAVVVTTPQPLAQEVASRAAAMAQKTGMQLAGVVENMTSEVFGSGGGERLATELGVRLLARIPLDVALREAGDAGVPLVLSDPDSDVADAFVELARTIDASRSAGFTKTLPLVQSR
jgi:ATP-binding protein involved in chromosome partitioning